MFDRSVSLFEENKNKPMYLQFHLSFFSVLKANIWCGLFYLRNFSFLQITLVIFLLDWLHIKFLYQ